MRCRQPTVSSGLILGDGGFFKEDESREFVWSRKGDKQTLVLEVLQIAA